uniref:[histone H4]-lysine(20) N-methyltransferase n=1 Tax=Parastrongyloides trichosuri TaxID=131310 RepID=A0A0N4ZKF2_PARTI
MIGTCSNIKRCQNLKSDVPEKSKCTPRRRGIRHVVSGEEALKNRKSKNDSKEKISTTVEKKEEKIDEYFKKEVPKIENKGQVKVAGNLSCDEEGSSDVQTVVNKNSEPKSSSAPNTPIRKKAQSRTKKGNRYKENQPPNIIKDEALTNHKITEYFPVRKSTRKTASQIEKERKTQLEFEICTKANEDHLEIYTDKVKGRGCKTRKIFKKGDFVIEYIGTLLSAKAANKLEKEYKKDENLGSYMYYFNHKGRNWCIDATKESPYKARLINHSCLRPNLKTKIVDIGDKFHLIMVALRDIEIGEELLYDYGDRTTESVINNPWLRNT